MLVYRIQKTKYGRDFSGYGSTLAAGRWHLPHGKPMLYTSSSRSLAILETLAHLPPGTRPPALTLLTLFVPDNSIVVIKESSLPPAWRDKKYNSDVQDFGMNWLNKNTSLAIAVPSAISQDQNILINAAHPDFNKVKLRGAEDRFTIDDRLL